ncbi:MAG: HEAT repeat domain-containing protein [Pyrinomonadaceae bacterium]|nr:HEAT repeat domain-containing protein [Pyrinomonadaceae bacterium]
MRTRKQITLVAAVLLIVSVAYIQSRNPARAEEARSEVSVQGQGFITVDGPDLKSKIDAAIKQGRARSPQTPFWTAYSFDVRPGVAVDAEWRNFKGSTTSYSEGTNISIGTSGGVTVETRNLGIFMLHEGGTSSMTRVEVYNLDRRREYSGYPVYWLGRGGNEESLNLLRILAESNAARKVTEHATVAIALHDDPRVGEILKNFVRNSQVEKVRSTAVFWLGQIGGEQTFLADLVRNEGENTEVRKQAAFAIGVSKDQTALASLQSLYGGVTNREVKKQIIFAASINENKDAGVDFLIKVAGSDADREARKQALFWLGQKAGERSLGALSDTINNSDADTEVQKHAVFAISQRARDESIPLLIKTARTHAKPEVRKQAMFWLGQTGDDRALEFFKEILTK